MKVSHLFATAVFAAATMVSQSSLAFTNFAECNSEEIIVFEGNIVEAAIATPELSTLVTAVTAAGLGDALATAEDVTVFAPTDDAFAKVPADVLNAALADTDILTAILLYHVAPGAYDPRKFVTAVRLDTLLDQGAFFHRKDGEQRVNNAVVTCTGVETDNGFVWLIDSVLLPQF